MASNAFTLTIHMVSSLDGIIAKKDNSVSWFETSGNYEKGVTGENPEEFLKSIDCYVMGSHTYEHALELEKTYGWAYGDTPTIVLTHRNLPVNKENIEIYAGDLDKFVQGHLKQKYRNVWIVGGAYVANEFIRLGLADEIRMTIIPIILGEGTPFFIPPGIEQALDLKDVKAYKNGILELHYSITRSKT